MARVFVKVEAERPLGNFKAWAACCLRALARVADAAFLHDLGHGSRAPLPRLICASDGNHGLAVASAARAGANARVYLPVDVSSARAQRIEALGAQVVRIHGTYDDAVCAATEAAASGDGLLPDTTSDPHDTIVQDVMDGYAVIARELVAQFRAEGNARPSHPFVQAGVGGIAAAMRESAGPGTTDSGAAGLAGLLHLAANPALRAEHRLDATAMFC